MPSEIVIEVHDDSVAGTSTIEGSSLSIIETVSEVHDRQSERRLTKFVGSIVYFIVFVLTCVIIIKLIVMLASHRHH
jgi:hypothetical protein